MINEEKLNAVLEGYKPYFQTRWVGGEDFKNKAISHFHTHWDENAEDFGKMFEEATAKTYSLLDSQNVYPRRTILNFAKADDNAVRRMFADLYDESVDLAARVDAFLQESKRLLEQYGNGKWKKDHQNTNTVSTYLWLMYPDKYYIYKFTEYRDAAKELESDYIPKRNGSAKTMIDGFGMYDEIRSIIKERSDIVDMYRSTQTDGYYKDPELITLTIDIGFYLSKYYLAEKRAAKEKKEWFPQDYAPGITVEKWVELLQDPDVFTPQALRIMARMKDYGGQATCKQLSRTYGETPNFYNRGSSGLAERVAKKTCCKVAPRDEGGERWWAILYLGKSAASGDVGTYIWKLRDELAQALEQVDLSNVPLHADMPEAVDGENLLAAVEKYSDQDFLSEVYMDEKDYFALKSLLKNRKNIILQGAPGVGKTFTAKRLAYAMMGEKDDSRVEMVQFHQNYSYEDFIMGYRPDGADFRLTEGIFYRFCQTASSHPDQDYFFIIDEINRGNLSKILGELMMLIEKGYRGTKITLPYAGKAFSVTENIYMIGMMNTADRSLALIDYALRRRFSFFPMKPGFDTDGFKAYQSELKSGDFDDLIKEVKVLNAAISEDPALGSGCQIGHSYFCGMKAEDCSPEWLRSIVKYDILPTLNEYWFDDKEQYQKFEAALNGVLNDK